MIIITLFLIFTSIVILVYVLSPLVARGTQKFSQSQAEKVVSSADIYLQDPELQRLYSMTMITPFVLAVAGFILFPVPLRLAGTVAGVVLGIILPRIMVKTTIAKRKAKFNDQLTDALMIMSSSFRAGLSLIQAVESVVEEMPDPLRREFGIVLGENKMGVALEDSLNRLHGRMPSVASQQMITAILLARETGGNLPSIFSRIINSMRERKKIEQQLNTLTIQGKIQAAVMTALPVFFFMGVSASNPKFFDIMLRIPQGQQLLMLCAVLWVVGAFFIIKISTFKEF